jgi:wobble nucleotide-excising tRNase
MSEYGYKVRLVQEECFSERLVAYHDEDFMEFQQAGEEATEHMSAQYCPRCKTTHAPDTYEAVDVYRDDVDIYPTRVDEWAHPELFR